MITLEQFKTQHSFTQVASQFGYHFTLNKINYCPICNKHSFSIYNNDTRYKCFRPSCELNKTGDIFNFLEIVGLSSNFKDSLKLLDISSSTNYQPKKQNSILNRVFSLYKEEFNKSLEAQDYLKSRGYNLNKFEVGYAPNNKFYLSELLPSNSDELLKYHLIKLNGEDYFQNRLVFPIRTLDNYIIHFHSRDLSNSSELTLRWMASKKRETSNIDYLWRGHIESKSKAIFLTEGISDALSLLTWDLPVVATMSIQADIAKLFSSFHNLEELHCIFDNDRQIISNHKSSYTYKSWEHILPQLINLKLQRPNLQIFCFMPPPTNGVKDLNDYCKLVSKSEFQSNYNESTLSLEDFTIKHFFKKSYYKRLLELCKYSKSLQVKLESLVESNYSSWIDFIMEVF
jgi:hypothetical protein